MSEQLRHLYIAIGRGLVAALSRDADANRRSTAIAYDGFLDCSAAELVQVIEDMLDEYGRKCVAERPDIDGLGTFEELQAAMESDPRESGQEVPELERCQEATR